MQLPNCVSTLILLMIADGLIVHSPAGPLVAPLGSSVVLPCYVDEPLLMEDLEVEWRRTDSETLVHLYQDGESRAESQQQDYHGRAHFFTDQIQHGNFSLRLDNLTAEDEGRYTCRVYSQQDSGETVVQIKDVVRLIVSGSSRSISASVGEDVTLNCSVDSHITPEHIEEVSWKKTDEDEDILVLLYQNHESLPDSSDERYRDRVEFFTAEILKGNFSLRLKSVRTEDKGVYMCQVFAGGLSANATVVLERLGFSVSHIMVLILCISASGSALLLCCLIYCRSHDRDSLLHLHVCLVLCPNIFMFFAFVFWGVSEGSLNELISCCALYFLRPLMLLWAAPYVHEFTGNIKTWLLKHSYIAEHVVFSIVVYLALFISAWEKLVNSAKLDMVVTIFLFIVVFLCCLCKIIYLLIAGIGKRSGWIINLFDIVADMIFDILPALQFILLFLIFGSAREGFIIIVILPVLLMLTNDRWFTRCRRVGCTESVMRTVWLIFILLINSVMIGLYRMAIEKELDPIGWAYVMGFLQILWAIMKFTDEDYYRYIAQGIVSIIYFNHLICSYFIGGIKPWSPWWYYMVPLFIHRYS
ncbi:uncharacterized protein LOC131537982 isoform X1 [Onychostoma macrolepis]|uniref:uncharacterized protein LOC131537982 isoform X1 n=1 Tax=Onychostoma macrolepis TaxID=369639 RepID=UPI002729F105|nr:uncharacterized protein LOC131537982 isoform X1 [Onychostoma macrolepis]XP_058627730.1 uncharacterized protein LOC131537982 isoform X1 [Onychostoma macrolepis]XP_058627731.1 uncharacterized protein LOC131537982 isoform X1 [Onychostoma macrolepis]XP_058627732.1 uncharacterized protein LOC131537982 isoform X1 [Onychostoma macrolepis]